MIDINLIRTNKELVKENIKKKLDNIKIANSIALGVLSKILGNLTMENVKKAYEKILKDKKELIQKNLDAYLLGYNYIQEKEYA